LHQGFAANRFNRVDVVMHRCLKHLLLSCGQRLQGGDVGMLMLRGCLVFFFALS